MATEHNAWILISKESKKIHQEINSHCNSNQREVIIKTKVKPLLVHVFDVLVKMEHARLVLRQMDEQQLVVDHTPSQSLVVPT